VKCQILRVLVSAFALVHFHYINCLFFFLPGEDEVSMPLNA
jgi:hypothetical protein